MGDTFTLQIRFRCMCFFVVDDRDPQKKRMVVLMPDTNRGHDGHDHGAAADPHVVRVLFHAEDGNGKLLGGQADSRKLERWELVLPGYGRPLDATLPDPLLNLSEKAGPVPAALLDGARDPRVITRINLPAGEFTDLESGATWDFDGKVREITQQVVWTIPNLPGKALKWHRIPFVADGEAAVAADAEDDAKQALPDIPAAEDGIVRLEVQHILESDFKNPGESREPTVTAEHFPMYYDLFDNPAARPGVTFVDHAESPTITCLNAGGSTGGGTGNGGGGTGGP